MTYDRALWLLLGAGLSWREAHAIALEFRLNPANKG
jgi:hypothetical protein